MRHIIVGDIHGCLQELEDLLLAIGPAPTDVLVSVGDLVNKGPDSGGVVRRLRELGRQMEVQVVLGNHEHRHLEIRRGRLRPSAEEVALQRQLTDEDMEFLHSFPQHLALPQHGAVVVHGGIPRGLERLDGWKDKKQLRTYRQLPFLKDQDEVFWAWSYDGRFGHCYFGHQPFMQSDPAHYPHATGLDLGCCAGGHLCAAILEVGKDPTFVTVPSRSRG